MPRFFVYGTLTEPERVAELLDRFDLGPEATLYGLHRIEGRYPTLAPGGEVEGRLLETPETQRLDAYEGVDSGLYVRVSVPVSDGDRETPEASRVAGASSSGDSVEQSSTDSQKSKTAGNITEQRSVSSPPESSNSAECYVGNPDRLDADAEWPGAGAFERRVRSYLDGHDVEIGHKE